MNRVVVAFIVVVAVLLGVIVLQWFLSRQKNKWLGLILPILACLNSLLMVLNVVKGGNIAAVFLLSNIPTIILLVIYFSSREKFRKKKQIEKMNLQDLE